jgi:hypothetical protein
LLACAAVVAGCAAEQPHARTPHAASAPINTATRWQYAILYGNGGGNFTFLSGTDLVSSGSTKDFEKLYRAITGGDERPPALGNRASVLLEALGRQGWGLVAVSGEQQLEFGRWYFKRPLR